MRACFRNSCSIHTARPQKIRTHHGDAWSEKTIYIAARITHPTHRPTSNLHSRVTTDACVAANPNQTTSLSLCAFARLCQPCPGTINMAVNIPPLTMGIRLLAVAGSGRSGGAIRQHIHGPGDGARIFMGTGAKLYQSPPTKTTPSTAGFEPTRQMPFDFKSNSLATRTS